MKTLNVKGHLANFCMIAEAAQKLNRHVNQIRAYEKKGVLPEPNFYLGKNRIYSETLINDLVEIFTNEISQGVKVSIDTRNKITAAFEKEKRFFNTPV